MGFFQGEPKLPTKVSAIRLMFGKDDADSIQSSGGMVLGWNAFDEVGRLINIDEISDYDVVATYVSCVNLDNSSED